MKTIIDGLNNGKSLEISVYFNEGGRNYFSGVTMPKGVYCSFWEVEKKPDGAIVRELFSNNAGFQILLEELTRKNSKKLEKLSKAIFSHASEITEFYKAGDKEAIMTLCRKIVD